MFFEGIRLMILGMMTVMFFLGTMVLSIYVVSWLTKGMTAQELEQLESAKQKENPVQQSKETVPIVVLTAAITAYEEAKKRLRFQKYRSN